MRRSAPAAMAYALQRPIAMARSRRRVYVVVIVGLIAILAGVGGVKGCQIRRLIAFGQAMEEAGPPPEAVGTFVAKTVDWEPTLTAVGTVAGRESVNVANDAAGRVTKIRFESGQRVKAGQVLVELDADVEKAQLESAMARRDRARQDEQRTRQLVDQRALPQQELDNAQTALATAEADVSAWRAQIENKLVKAPFDGRVGIRAVNLGQYLPAGTTVTTVSSGGPMYVDFSLPQERLPTIRTGMPVRIGIRDREIATGTIAAIDPTLDRATRDLRLRANVAEDGELRSGMFVTVTVVLPERRRVVIVPLTAVVHAPYGDSVFVVDDQRIARQRFVRIGATHGDFVEITRGVSAGDTVVSEGAFKLRNGSRVTIDNRVKLEPSLHPQPENR